MEKERLATIYVLRDPITNEIRKVSIASKAMWAKRKANEQNRQAAA